MPLTVVCNDITKMNVDAIVNAANTELLMGGGVCGAIFNAAGVEELQAACDRLSPILTGTAVMTPGFALPTKHIIHTAGPVYRDGSYGEEGLLRSCYTNTLNLAQKNGCESIAFPLISSGIYGYPKDEALAVATSAIGEWLINNDVSDGMDVSLVILDKSAFTFSQELLGEVEAFIDEHYIGTHSEADSQREVLELNINVNVSLMSTRRQYNALDDVVGHLDEPFSVTLLHFIDMKGKTGAEVYKRANFDRRLFSKITSDKDYRPKKETVAAFAVALELTLRETYILFMRAGFTLSRSVMFDVIIEFFIRKGIYDIFEINNALYKYDQPILGGKVRD